MIELAHSRLLQRLQAVPEALGNQLQGFLSVVQEAHETAARFDALAHLSDSELARHGLKREGLAQAVFAAPTQP